MLNPIEEAKHAKLREMCRELRVPPPPEIYIGLKVVDRNGALVFDDKQRGHSWTRNYWNYMFSLGSDSVGDNTSTFGAGYMTGKQLAGPGTVRGYNNCVCTRCRGYVTSYDPAYCFYNAIVVGTGDTAFSVNDWAMAALVENGSGSGQLVYNNQTRTGPTYTSGTKTWSFAHTRIFNNNSGGSITIKEVGLNAYIGIAIFNNASGTWLLERSLLDPTVEVAKGAQLTVTYTISQDFSAIDS